MMQDFIDRFDRHMMKEEGREKRRVCPAASYALAVVGLAFVVLVVGCGATVTVNILSSHSRYGQAIGGTNTVIRGVIEGGGSLQATAPLAP